MDTIGSRVRAYRFLVVTLIATGLCSVVFTLVARAVSPLSGMILLVPLCCFCFYIDGRLVNRWRSVLLSQWIKGEIGLKYFSDAVLANPAIPKEMLQGMLETLPLMTKDPGLSSATREVVAASVAFSHTHGTDSLLVTAVGCAIAGISLVVAAILQDWHPLFGMVVIALIPLIQQAVKVWRLRKARRVVLIAREKPDYSNERYLEVLAHLHQSHRKNYGFVVETSAQGT